MKTTKEEFGSTREWRVDVDAKPVNRKMVTGVLGAILTVALICAPASAGNFSLTDKASDADIEVPGLGGAGGPIPGNTSVRVNDPADRPTGDPSRDELEHMEQQWYWLGVDGNNPQTIDNLGGATLLAHDDLDNDGNNDRLRFQYTDGDTLVRVQYRLLGSDYPDAANPDSGYAATVLRQVDVVNISNDPHSYKLFDLTDLALTNIIGTGHDPELDESARLLPSPASGLDERIIQSDQHATLGEISAAVTSFLASNADPNDPSTNVKYKIVSDNSLVGFIEGGSDLDDSGNPTDPAGIQSGTDIQFATQWDFKLDPGKGFSVQESLQIVPEPATLSLLGLLGAAAIRRRR
jgi:hypothetical protein